MRRRIAARMALPSALMLLLGSVVLCPARCLAGDLVPQAATPPCHHEAPPSPGGDASGLPTSAAHASCCVTAVSSPSVGAAPTPHLVATPADYPPPPPTAWSPSAGEVRIAARGAPPRRLYLRLRTLLV